MKNSFIILHMKKEPTKSGGVGRLETTLKLNLVYHDFIILITPYPLLCNLSCSTSNHRIPRN